MCRNHLLYNGPNGEPSSRTPPTSSSHFEPQSQDRSRTASSSSSSINLNVNSQPRTLLSNPVDRDFLTASINAARRRSVDVGGLALALGASTLGDEMGKGWGGWEEDEDIDASALYAELLSDMYTQTQSAVSMPVLSSFPTVTPAARTRLIETLDSWKFEPHKLPDDEVLVCGQLLFEALLRVEGMQDTVNVSLDQLSSFLMHLRLAYRASNSYHNFQHALDVFQATHMYLRLAGVVPRVDILRFPASDPRGKWKPHHEVRATWVGILTKEDIFALYIAAIGHDVGHPGFNNIFMKNAQAPLSQVYDHKSALEQMHCAFLLPIMKRHGLAHLLSRELQPSSCTPSQCPPSSSSTPSSSTSTAPPTLRKLLLETVLATDMGVHKQFMERFERLMEHPEHFDIVQARILVCQALIKCADISNPSRPHTVSQHWSAALAAEWAAQAMLEKQLRLPVSVQESADDPIAEARGQMAFITLFCLPLLQITTIAIKEMKCFVEQCDANCMLWATRLKDLNERSKAQARGQGPGSGSSSSGPGKGGGTVRSKSPLRVVKQASSTNVNGKQQTGSSGFFARSATKSGLVGGNGNGNGLDDERIRLPDSSPAAPQDMHDTDVGMDGRAGGEPPTGGDDAPNYPPVPYPQRTLSPSIPQQDYQTVFPLSLPVRFLHEQLQMQMQMGLTRQASMSSLNGDGGANGIGSGSGVGSGVGVDVVVDGYGYGYGQGGQGVGDADVSMSPHSGSGSGSRSPSPFANGTPNPFAQPSHTISSSLSPPTMSRNLPFASIPSPTTPPLVTPTPNPLTGFGARPQPSISTLDSNNTSTGGSEFSSPSTTSDYARSRMLSSASSASTYTVSVSDIRDKDREREREKEKDPQGSIRAAYKLSVRKKRSFHRNSWTPSLNTGAVVPPVPSLPFQTTMSGGAFASGPGVGFGFGQAANHPSPLGGDAVNADPSGAAGPSGVRKQSEERKDVHRVPFSTSPEPEPEPEPISPPPPPSPPQHHHQLRQPKLPAFMSIFAAAAGDVDGEDTAMGET